MAIFDYESKKGDTYIIECVSLEIGYEWQILKKNGQSLTIPEEQDEYDSLFVQCEFGCIDSACEVAIKKESQ